MYEWWVMAAKEKTLMCRVESRGLCTTEAKGLWMGYLVGSPPLQNGPPKQNPDQDKKMLFLPDFMLWNRQSLSTLIQGYVGFHRSASDAPTACPLFTATE